MVKHINIFWLEELFVISQPFWQEIPLVLHHDKDGAFLHLLFRFVAGFEPFPRRLEFSKVVFILGDCASPPLELHGGWGWATLFVFEWMVFAERLSGLAGKELSSVVLVSFRR
jgi:hypothetical protein